MRRSERTSSDEAMRCRETEHKESEKKKIKDNEEEEENYEETKGG